MIFTTIQLPENYRSIKVSKGKWNLEVTQEAVEQIEKTFNAPSAPVLNQEILFQ